MYPEWIQEQLDKLGTPPRPLRADQAEERVRAHLGIISHRFDRIEAKLDRLLAYCEGD